MKIDIICNICFKRLGQAKVAIPLRNASRSNITGPTNYRLLMVDPDDLDYWQKQHTPKDCHVENMRQQGRMRELVLGGPDAPRIGGSGELIVD